MAKPVRVFIDGQELIGYTDLSLQRSKDQLTGSLDITIFMGWVPNEAVLPGATKGGSINVYVGGHLAFNGVIDRRTDSGSKTADGDSNRSMTIGANEYTVKFTARGKTKYLIDSSHQHPTGTMLKPTNKSILEKLIEPWNIGVVWEADVIDIDRIRFRDGGRVIDELRRLATQFSLFIHEDVQGRLHVSDDQGTQVGEPIALGTNILSFTTDQSEETERSQITVKGQLTEVGKWGTDAVIPTLLQAADNAVKSFIPIGVQVFGNATPELLDRRAQFEANKRNSRSKKITVEVFHVQSTTGRPWSIGDLHYVSIPPAGVNSVMEITELTYNVGVDNLTTSITLTPPPVKAKTGKAAAGGGVMSGVTSKPGGGIGIRGTGEANVGGFTSSELQHTEATKVVAYEGAAPVLGSVEASTAPPLTIQGPQ